MTTECYELVRGSVIRSTALTPCGDVDEALLYAVSNSLSKIDVTEVVESASNELIRADESDIRLRLVRPAESIRYKVDIRFIRCDPGVLNLMTGVPLVLNSAGNVAGFDRDTRVPAKSFALEVWSRLVDGACASVLIESGFGEGGFGMGGFGGSAPYETGPRWGYTLLPFLKGGTVSGFTFANGLVSFNLKGAQTRRGGSWGIGPWIIDESGLSPDTEVSGNTHWRQYLTYGQPPEVTDGIVEAGTATSFDGGIPSFIGSDSMDGGTPSFVGDDVIEGGSAA